MTQSLAMPAPTCRMRFPGKRAVRLRKERSSPARMNTIASAAAASGAMPSSTSMRTISSLATALRPMNAMPRLADTTDGVFRRLSFVPFRRRFSPSDEDFDPNIIERLTTPETLRRFAVLGLFALPGLIRRGTLSAIPDMDAEIETVRIDNSIVRRWLFDENLTRDELVGRTTQEVFEQFKSWCEASGERYILNKTSFSKELLATVGNMKSAVLLSERYGRKMRTYVGC